MRAVAFRGTGEEKGKGEVHPYEVVHKAEKQKKRKKKKQGELERDL
jgi:hypothetical protein